MFNKLKNLPKSLSIMGVGRPAPYVATYGSSAGLFCKGAILAENILGPYLSNTLMAL
jgi:hypothetical protein